MPCKREHQANIMQQTNPFLYDVAHDCHRRLGDQVSRCTFVFPNRRAGRFFSRYLSQIAGKPIFSPTITTIADLFAELSIWQPADSIYLQFAIYNCYREVSGSNESFEDFMFWGNMLLNDFNDVDKSLSDARQLFRNIQDIKDIDSDLSYLSQEQIEAVSLFWTNFLSGDKTDRVKQDFQKIWVFLPEIYHKLRRHLADEGVAYEGMIFREVAERAKKMELSLLSHQKIVFVGLHSHSEAEKCLLDFVKKQGVADFYHDYGFAPIQDKENRASLFVRENVVRYPSLADIPPSPIENSPPIHVEAIAIPSAVGQAKHTHSILQELICRNKIAEKHFTPNTAIVLADENLLIPTLYSIPTEIEKINITMGYPLKATSIVALMNHIYHAHRNIRQTRGTDAIYHKFVLPILSHSHIRRLVGTEAENLRKSIALQNKISVPIDELSQNPLLKLIFAPTENTADTFRKIRDILSLLHRQLSELSSPQQEEETPHSPAQTFDIECEFIYTYYKAINRIEETIHKLGLEIKPETLFLLIHKATEGLSVAFEGEPLCGLQVMGILETRAIDFENLIILSMNEGIFPAKRIDNSFIPYNLRKGFGLPTYEHRDSIFAYHFYRLISRAKNVYLLYDTRTNASNMGEASRYLYQMKYLYPQLFHIQEYSVSYQVPPQEKSSIEISKTPQVMKKLEEFLAGGNRALSASAINTYLTCPLKFYFEVVEGMQEGDQVEETVEANIFGSIYHHVMEHIYRPFEGKRLTPEILKKCAQNQHTIHQIIEQAFALHYFKTSTPTPLEGQNLLVGEVIKKYVVRTLWQDARRAPFTYIKGEKRFEQTYPLPSGKQVKLKGFIDRIDEQEGILHIIDYKTGQGKTTFSSVESLFNSDDNKRPKAVMQVFLYALMYQNEHPDATISPGIYFLRNIFSADFQFATTLKNKEQGEVPIRNFDEYREDFCRWLNACLEEIFNPHTPFRAGTTEHHCPWCGM